MKTSTAKFMRIQNIQDKYELYIFVKVGKEVKIPPNINSFLCLSVCKSSGCHVSLSACVAIKMSKQSRTSNKLTVLFFVCRGEGKRVALAGDGMLFGRADGLMCFCL